MQINSEGEIMQINSGDQIFIDGFVFVCICSALPEAYDVYYEESNEICAYVKVRYGKVRCWYPDYDAEPIYEHNLEDMQGAFYKHEQRMLHLTAIAKAINAKLGIRQ